MEYIISKGDNVRVTSNCRTKGCTGVVQSIDNFFQEAVVKLDTLPGDYYGNGVSNYSMNSLELVVDKKPKEVTSNGLSSGGNKVLGVFLSHAVELDELKQNGLIFPDEGMVVYAHTPEECLNLLDVAIEKEGVDSDYYTHLVFGTWVFEIKPIVKRELKECLDY